MEKYTMVFIYTYYFRSLYSPAPLCYFVNELEFSIETTIRKYDCIKSNQIY